MTCKFPGCNRKTDPAYPCCSIAHGARYKEGLELAKAFKTDDLLNYGMTQWEKLSEFEKNYYLQQV